MRGNGLELRFLAMTRTVFFTDNWCLAAIPRSDFQ